MDGRKPANGAFFLPVGMEDEFLDACLARPGALADAAAPPPGAEEEEDGPPCGALRFGAVARCLKSCLGALPPPAARGAPAFHRPPARARPRRTSPPR